MKCFTINFDSGLTAESSIRVSRSNAYYFSVGNEKMVVSDSAVSFIKEYSGSRPVIQNVSLRTQVGRTVFAAPTPYSADELDALVLLTTKRKHWAKELNLHGIGPDQKIAETNDHTTILFVWRLGQELTFHQTGEEQTERNVRRPRKHLGVFTGTDTIVETHPKEEILHFRFDGQVFTKYSPQERVDVVLPTAVNKDPELARIELSMRSSATADNQCATLNHALSMLENLRARAILTPGIREQFIQQVATISDAFVRCNNLPQAERALKLGLHTLYACAEGLNIGNTRKLFAEELIYVQARRRDANALPAEENVKE